MKVLLLDIESAPHTAFVWGLFDQNISTNQVIASGGVLCWSAKWLGQRGIMFDSVMKSKPKAMLKGIHALLDEADVVVTYNGNKFDLPMLAKEFVQHGMAPPSPYKSIDLYRTARSVFRFPSNKLDFLSQQLGIGQKVKHAGFTLWIDCMNRDPKAWKQMERYNKQDVALLEKLYDRLRPWIRNHPNRGLYDDGIACVTCGSQNLQRRGIQRTVNTTYARLQCNDCGSWMRSAIRGERRPVPMRHAA
jgi:Predicted exonuclease